MAAGTTTGVAAKPTRRGEYTVKPEYQAFAAALKRHRQASGEYSTQALLAEALGVSWHAVGSWERAIWAPAPEKVFDAERVLGLPPGSLSRHLGYVPTGAQPSLVSAIDADPKLDAKAKTLLTEMYKSLARKRAVRPSA